MTREVNVDVKHLIALERVKFEAWAKTKKINLVRSKNRPEEYAFSQNCWEAWIAALRLEAA